MAAFNRRRHRSEKRTEITRLVHEFFGNSRTEQAAMQGKETKSCIFRRTGEAAWHLTICQNPPPPVHAMAGH